ncbi:hypothetical protein EBS80_02330 [bacterium]|nr:hypothetical protein [bacterium]
MTSRSKSTPAREWKQVRVPPAECKAIQTYARATGLAFPAALRLVLRQGLGWVTPVTKKPWDNDSEALDGYDTTRLK